MVDLLVLFLLLLAVFICRGAISFEVLGPIRAGRCAFPFLWYVIHYRVVCHVVTLGSFGSRSNLDLSPKVILSWFCFCLINLLPRLWWHRHDAQGTFIALVRNRMRFDWFASIMQARVRKAMTSESGMLRKSSSVEFLECNRHHVTRGDRRVPSLWKC